MVGIDSHLGQDMQDDDTCTPIHRMPVELLVEVFAKYIGDNQGRPGPKSFSALTSHRDSDATPFLLGSVCAYWRSITLSTPTLWSSLYVYSPTERFVPAVECWLDRAGTLPLSLSLSETPRQSCDQNDATDRILKIFVQHIDRWKKINFRLSKTSQSSFLHLPEGAAKILESAKLDTRSWEYVNMDSVWHSLHASPLLSEIEWDGRYIERMPNHVPWTQLTHITFFCPLNIETLLQILQTCQQIVTLDVYHFLPSYAPPTVISQDFLILPRLRNLKINPKTGLGDLLNRLTLPALVNLDIRNKFPTEIPRDFPALHEFFNRSSCRLQELTLMDYEIPEDDLLQYLIPPCLATLHKLQLFSYAADKTITALTLNDTNGQKGYLLPNLESILLNECRASDGALSRMVASRFNVDGYRCPINSLKHVEVYLRQYGSTFVNDLLSLEAMREKGLQVHIKKC